MNLEQFKEVTLCDEVLSRLTTYDRANLMAYIGNGIITYILKNTPYYYANSIQRYYPIDGMIIQYVDGSIDIHGMVEVKTYYNIDHKRNSDKYFNYQIDANKLTDITAEARRHGTRPLLFCFFSNELVVWDLDKTDWFHTIKNVETNDTGVNYGRTKSKGPQAYLPLRDAIYRDKTINIDYYYSHIHKELLTKPMIEDDTLSSINPQ